VPARLHGTLAVHAADLETFVTVKGDRFEKAHMTEVTPATVTMNPPLDLADLRRETAKKPYWVPPPNGGDRVHRVRIDGSRSSCWVISLECSGNGDYLFPSGDDLEQVIEPNQPNGSGDNDDKINAELLGHGQNGH
jgi:hypothetical protein